MDADAGVSWADAEPLGECIRGRRGCGFDWGVCALDSPGLEQAGSNGAGRSQAPAADAALSGPHQPPGAQPGAVNDLRSADAVCRRRRLLHRVWWLLADALRRAGRRISTGSAEPVGVICGQLLKSPRRSPARRRCGEPHNRRGGLDHGTSGDRRDRSENRRGGLNHARRVSSPRTPTAISKIGRPSRPTTRKSLTAP